jgi:hypothetical protein
VERGTHAALLAREGVYHNLYIAQFKGHLHLVPELERICERSTVSIGEE